MIKPWKERLTPDANGQYLAGVKDAMQAEIDDYKAALATARREERERVYQVVEDALNYQFSTPSYVLRKIHALTDEPKE